MANGDSWKPRTGRVLYQNPDDQRLLKEFGFLGPGGEVMKTGGAVRSSEAVATARPRPGVRMTPAAEAAPAPSARRRRSIPKNFGSTLEE